MTSSESFGEFRCDVRGDVYITYYIVYRRWSTYQFYRKGSQCFRKILLDYLNDSLFLEVNHPKTRPGFHSKQWAPFGVRISIHSLKLTAKATENRSSLPPNRKPSFFVFQSIPFSGANLLLVSGSWRVYA